MRKHNYVVGFGGEGQCVYGKDDSLFSKDSLASTTQPMTILQAIRQLKTLTGDKKTIYRLVEIDPKKEKFKQKILNQMVKKTEK